MSLISEEIKRLEGVSEFLSEVEKWAPFKFDNQRKVIADAIDTIQAQSAKLVAHNLRNGWIPCDERLPKEDEQYLCCFDDGFIATASWIDGDWELWADSGDVIAWMPLPEPYEEEK